ncbi:MAG: diaminopimelate decarboxylase [Chthonomonas sp.]|nr:diaminopimelate decarboxylase [Chthonomonas sp.]
MSDDRFVLDDSLAIRLAEEFGTPLYVVSEEAFRSRLRRYRKAFSAAYPATRLSYASKANSILAVLRIAHDEGFDIDVASEGELRAALLAGVPASDCHLHGNAKTEREIDFALEQGIGEILVDNFRELDRLAARNLGATKLMLRLAPGVDPKTHRAISTGQADTKFGFNIADGSAEKAVEICFEKRLPLHGFHCHVGSQLLDPEAQRAGGAQIASFAIEMEQKHGFVAELLNVGGGLGVRYLADYQPMQVDEYCQLIVDAVLSHLGDRRPTLAQEPGRSMIAEAGVTLYRVEVIKEVPTMRGRKRYVVVDGGLSDNPRSAMYEAKYEVRSINGAGGPATCTISGKHCETDTLFADIDLPGDLKEGHLIQVLCTGAYNASMASNYNRYPRPACVLIGLDGEPMLIQRRENWDEVFSSQVLPD